MKVSVVGLTGGIGSGKTTVANCFKHLFDIPIYTSDQKAKDLMVRDIGLKKNIIALLGSQAYFSDATLNKKYIASCVFKNQSLLSQLNALVHPIVAQDFDAWKEKQTSDYVIKESAILFEKSIPCDYSILVITDINLRKQRLLQRSDKLSLSQIEARIKQQWTDGEKRSLADFIIENNGVMNVLDLQIKKIHKKITSK